MKRSRSLAGIALVFLVLFPLNAAVLLGQGKAQQPPAPQIIAVKFHADWCGFCKAMGPVFTDLENKFDGKPVLFVTLDLTNVTTLNRSKLLASALGIGPVYKANEGTTGLILLLDGKTRQVAARLNSEHTLKDMAAALDEALSKTGG